MAKQIKATARPGIVAQLVLFLQEVRSEMDRVTWPSREDLKASTSVVLMFLALLAVIVGVLDVLFQNVVLWLFKLT